MHLTAQYTLTPNEALRGTRAFKRLWYGVSLGAGLLLMALGAARLWMASGPRVPGVFMILNGLVFLVMPELALRWARRRRGSAPYTPMDLTLNDEGLALSTADGTGGLPWEAFAQVRRRDGFWVFQLNRQQAVLVPERALDPTASRELDAFLRARKLLRG